MIKCEEGHVQMKGNVPTLITEYSIITKGLFDALKKDGIKEEYAKQWIKDSMENAFMTTDEIKTEIKEKFARLMDKLFGEE